MSVSNEPTGRFPYTIQWYLLSLLFWAVAVNYPWEMLQMPLFNGMPFSDPMSWLICFRASLGDGVIVIVIWGTGYLLFHNVLWFRRRKFGVFAVLLLAGGLIAIAVEIHALNNGRWSYSDLMPVLPVAGVGLSPFIQLLILPGLAMGMAWRIPVLKPRRK